MQRIWKVFLRFFRSLRGSFQSPHVPTITGLLIATVLTWHRILLQTLQEEGFYYFLHGFTYLPVRNFLKDLLYSYDSAAKLLFDLFRILFRDNLFLYQFFVLLSVCLIVVWCYFFVYEIFRNRSHAAISTLLFATNYSGYEMLALGNIQFFLQRGLSLVGMLPALIFFVRYLREKGTSARVYYFLSLFVYIISFVLFHFSLFFALFFGCILGAFLIEKRLGGKYMWVKVLTFVPFVVFPVLLVGSGHGSTLMSDTNLPSFFATHKSELLVKMLNLYTVLMVPDQTIGYMANRFQISRELFISKISIPVILTTFGFFGLIARARSRGAGALALACLVYIPFALFIAIYLRWELVNDLAGRSRYLYIPSVVSSLFWGIFLWSVLYVKRGFRTAIALGILVVVIAFNIKTIAEVMDADQYKHEATKQSLDFIRKLAPGLQNDAIVILPNVIGYHGTDFVQLFYGKPHTYFLPKFALNVAPLPRPFDPAKDVIIDYDYEAKAVRDLTNGYKGILP